jgi:D-alanyl-D-alanine dipeptidase
MTSLAVLTVLMMPIYLGWALCLLAPILFPAMILSVAGSHRLFTYSKLRKVIQRHSRTMTDATVTDDQSPIVSFGEFFPALLLKQELIDDGPVTGRMDVGDRLLAAQGFLPEGLKLQINECFRSNSDDLKLINAIGKKLREAKLGRADDLVFHDSVHTKPVFADSGQNTGGSCDITLVDMDDQEINLGLKTLESLDWLGRMSPSLESKEILANRGILAAALGQAGFVNCPLEWWRWSYGDRYWSVVTNAKAAIYGALPRSG